MIDQKNPELDIPEFLKRKPDEKVATTPVRRETAPEFFVDKNRAAWLAEKKEKERARLAVFLASKGRTL